jgi:hypothetical protein
MNVLSLAAIMLAGLTTYALAHDRCPELTRLHREANEALKKATGMATSDRCEAYTRFTMAWGNIASYAKNHRAPCGITANAFDEINKRRADAAELTRNSCMGRRPPFPAEIRW